MEYAALICTLYNVQCTLYTNAAYSINNHVIVQCTVYTIDIHCTVHSIVYTVQCKHYVAYTIEHRTSNTQFTVCRILPMHSVITR